MLGFAISQNFYRHWIGQQRGLYQFRKTVAPRHRKARGAFAIRQESILFTCSAYLPGTISTSPNRLVVSLQSLHLTWLPDGGYGTLDMMH